MGTSRPTRRGRPGRDDLPVKNHDKTAVRRQRDCKIPVARQMNRFLPEGKIAAVAVRDERAGSRDVQFLQIQREFPWGCLRH